MTKRIGTTTNPSQGYPRAAPIMQASQPMLTKIILQKPFIKPPINWGRKVLSDFMLYFLVCGTKAIHHFLTLKDYENFLFYRNYHFISPEKP